MKPVRAYRESEGRAGAAVPRAEGIWLGTLRESTEKDVETGDAAEKLCEWTGDEG